MSDYCLRFNAAAMEVHDLTEENARLQKRIAELEEDIEVGQAIAVALQKRIAELEEEIQDRADTEASLVKQLMKATEGGADD